MKVHHLNCATMCPPLGKLLNPAGRLVCHCLLIEADAGLVLVDTGFGTQDLQEPRQRLGPGFAALAGLRLDPAQTALAQIQQLGHQPRDVRHILLTHLDLDHAGGLADFPEAQVHVYAAEHRAAMARVSAIERVRYRPLQWQHGPHWTLYEPRGEPWYGFESARDLPGLPPEILSVPLIGHTRGHCAIAVRGDAGWLLHCGDAYFYKAEVDPEHPRCGAALGLYQRFLQADGAARVHNQERLRALVREHGTEVRVFCAHDPDEFAAAQG